MLLRVLRRVNPNSEWDAYERSFMREASQLRNTYGHDASAGAILALPVVRGGGGLAYHQLGGDHDFLSR